MFRTSIPRLRSGLKLRLNATAGLAVACLCAPALGDSVSETQTSETQASETQSTETVQSLRYGVSLFYYYQHAYFDALTELMVGASKQELADHAESAPLLEGGMALSYGMDQHAQTIFQDLLANNTDHTDHDRAWFFLGKAAWQRGEPQRAADILSNVSSSDEFERSEETQYLKAAALLNTGDPTAAQALHATLDDTSRWRNYLSYNLGAERANAADWQGAADYFSHFNTPAAVTAEDAALKEKSLTASGYSYLSAGKPELAQAAFRQVHTDGPMAARALLGYGWSAAEQDDYLGALSPWHELAKRSALNASVREGLLAVPYAYVRLGRSALALAHYRRASSTYKLELGGLDEALTGFRTKPVPELIGLDDSRSAEWQFDRDIFPDSSEAPFLQHLLTRHSFQIGLRELRDLYHIEKNLLQATQRLHVLTEVDAHQQHTWTSIVEEERRDSLAVRQQQVNESLRTLRARVNADKAQEDGRTLADEAQTARWARVERATSAAAQIGQFEKHKNALQLLRGLLLWSDSETYPARIWQAQRELRDLEILTSESAVALQRVDSAIADKQQSVFAPRIAATKERVRKQQHNAQVTIAQAEQNLRKIAIAELERQSDQLRRALGQSELAIAQLYDQGLEGAQQ